MHQPDFEAARQYALDRLQRELSLLVTYHSLAHTVDEVAPAADHLAALEGVTGEDLLLLRTAALYHDVGFVEQHHDHEAGSARIAAAVLPGFGYAPAQIQAIVGMILATQLPQTPHTLLEQIMADADLNILGHADYLPRNAALRAELAAFGLMMTDTQWYGGQLKFIRDHRYFTASARQLCDAQKQINVAAMAALLAQSP
ncbi:MAG: HD domain-containing protein [Chloroflexi bacterium]|nr:HD domain-containing protein [Chloroflexota bacterium]